MPYCTSHVLPLVVNGLCGLVKFNLSMLSLYAKLLNNIARKKQLSRNEKGLGAGNTSPLRVCFTVTTATIRELDFIVTRNCQGIGLDFRPLGSA